MVKHAAVAQKTPQTTTPGASPDASAGPRGIAIAPPAYGIDIVDRRSAETAPEPGWEQQAPALDGPIQMRAAFATGGDAIALPENKTGLPDNLKAGIESLSGLAMNDVRVHYNSARPAQLQALAYTQGADIHVGPGQERYLPHEAWHVVQQKQGRVQPTLQMKGMTINDEAGLEHEADVMGAKAAQMNCLVQFRCAACREEEEREIKRGASTRAPVQMYPCQGTTHDTSNEHRVIEVDYITQINPNAAREYEIPHGSLTTNNNGVYNTGYADIADMAARELYEIKRYNEQYPQAQLNRYLQEAHTACHGNWTAGNYYPSERIIDFSAYEVNKEIVARKDPRPGFIRYEKRNRGGGLGIAAALGGGVYVGGIAAAANLPAIDQWVTIWTQQIWESAENPESIDDHSAPYINAVQQIQQIVQNVRNHLRGGTLDRDILRNGWSSLQALINGLGF